LCFQKRDGAVFIVRQIQYGKVAEHICGNDPACLPAFATDADAQPSGIFASYYAAGQECQLTAGAGAFLHEDTQMQRHVRCIANPQHPHPKAVPGKTAGAQTNIQLVRPGVPYGHASFQPDAAGQGGRPGRKQLIVSGRDPDLFRKHAAKGVLVYRFPVMPCDMVVLPRNWCVHAWCEQHNIVICLRVETSVQARVKQREVRRQRGFRKLPGMNGQGEEAYRRDGLGNAFSLQRLMLQGGQPAESVELGQAGRLVLFQGGGEPDQDLSPAAHGQPGPEGHAGYSGGDNLILNICCHCVRLMQAAAGAKETRRICADAGGQRL